VSEAARHAGSFDPRREAEALANHLRSDPSVSAWATETVNAYREGRISETPLTREDVDRLIGDN